MRTKRRGSQTVTIRAVAERAGVSAMTVSNVLNGRGSMSGVTRQAVLEAMEALSYQPNPAARMLAQAETLRIGFVQPNTHNAFLSAILVGALQSCGLTGAQLVLRSTPTRTMAALSNTMRQLVANGASGILMAPPFAEMFEGSTTLAELAVPVAAVGPGRPLAGILSVRIDDRAAACAMVSRLIALGHRRIAFVTGPDSHSSSRARAEGYRDAITAHGLVADPALIAHGTFEFETSIAPIRILLDRCDPPTAVFASNDNMAAAAIVVAHQLGLGVPGALAIAGFDDDVIASRLWPPLTTVRQPVEAMAHAAVSALIARIRGHAVADDQILPFELIERDSTRGGTGQ